MPRRPELYRMAKAMLDLYCDSFPIVPSHLTLDLDESFDRVHGELRWTPLVGQLGWRVSEKSRGIIAPYRCWPSARAAG